MDINTVLEGDFLTLFGDGKNPVQQNSGFAATGVDTNVSILSTTETTTLSPSTTETTIVSSSTTDTTIASASTTDQTTQVVDVFAPDTTKGAQTIKHDFSDISGYFQDRIKSGKFVKIKEDSVDGNSVDFVPKTPEEFDEVFDLQVNYKLESERKNLMQQLYQSKSPAWQAVLKYSELVDDPAEVAPFITGVKTMESVAQADENTPEGAEKIIRARLQQRGDTDDLIDEQIETLRGADKLLPTAKVYKPMIIQQEQAALSQMMTERQQEQNQYLQMVEDIEKEALKAIETPLFGKQKLTKDEKALVYEMIAYPSQETKGYNIFSKIDELFTSGDFETLKLISLLAGGKKDSVFKYVAANAANATAANAQKVLRVAAATQSSSNTNVDDDIPIVRRTSFRGQFGRG